VYSNSKEIFASLPIDYPLAKVSVPQRGDKKSYLSFLSVMRNTLPWPAKKMAEKANPNERQDRLLETMQKDLR
jgi:hypothetical protein